MKKLLWVALLAAAPGSAQAMNVASFLTKVEGLEKKGMMAVFSSDFKLLKTEVQGHLKTIRAERAALAAAHKATPFCPSGGRADLERRAGRLLPQNAAAAAGDHRGERRASGAAGAEISLPVKA